MLDLSTRYMGLELKNPLVIASCGLTTTLQGVENCARAGAGAIVLKSLFEEQINVDVAALTKASADVMNAEGLEYLEGYGHACGPRDYLTLVREAKQAVDIPVIASVNCVSGERWADYAAQLARAGADALEVNIGFLPNDAALTGQQVEDRYAEILQAVKARVEIPVALKIGAQFSSFSNLAHRLGSGPGAADALVLFNRFYRLDIDVKNLKVSAGNPYSTREEIHSSLRWILLLAGKIDAELAATTGIHNGDDVIKQLLAGATVTQLCSTIYRNGFSQIQAMLQQLVDWMVSQNFNSLADFRGRLCQTQSEDPDSYERLQYIKGLTGIE